MIEIQSENVTDLIMALVSVQGEIRDAEKNSKGQVGKDTSYRYANLEAVIEATREPFAKHKLVVSQLASMIDGKPVLITQLMHSSGQWLRSVMPILNERGTAQGLGSGLSYARRYSLAALAGITQTDDDGEEASKPKALKPSGAPSPIKPAGRQDFPGDYLMTFGPFGKNKALKDIKPAELANYMAQVEAEAKAKNKQITGVVATFMTTASDWLAICEEEGVS